MFWFSQSVPAPLKNFPIGKIGFTNLYSNSIAGISCEKLNEKDDDGNMVYQCVFCEGGKVSEAMRWLNFKLFDDADVDVVTEVLNKTFGGAGGVDDSIFDEFERDFVLCPKCFTKLKKALPEGMTIG